MQVSILFLGSRTFLPCISRWVYRAAWVNFEWRSKPVLRSFKPLHKVRHSLVRFHSLVVFIDLKQIEGIGIGFIIYYVEHQTARLILFRTDRVGPHLLEELLTK